MSYVGASKVSSKVSSKPRPVDKNETQPVDKNEEAQKRKPRIVCFGEMLIDFVPTVAGVSLAEAVGFKKAAGGAPANVAVQIARLGGSAAFIGKVHFKFPWLFASLLSSF